MVPKKLMAVSMPLHHCYAAQSNQGTFIQEQIQWVASCTAQTVPYMGGPYLKTCEAAFQRPPTQLSPPSWHKD